MLSCGLRRRSSLFERELGSKERGEKRRKPVLSKLFDHAFLADLLQALPAARNSYANADSDPESLVRRCADPRHLPEARRLHAQISSIHGGDARSGESSHVANLLMLMYGKCCSLPNARAVFDRILHRDLRSWNTMIAAYAQQGHERHALALFRDMQSHGFQPNTFTLVPLLSASANLGDLEEGKRIHRQILTCGFQTDVAVCNALITMYGKCGRPIDARDVFEKMGQRNAVSWNAMMAVYNQNRLARDALSLFHQMDLDTVKPTRVTFLGSLSACSTLVALEHGRTIHRLIVVHGFESDIAIMTALLTMYSKCGSLKDASIIFEKMHARDVVCWSAMIAAYAQNGKGREALKLLQRMELDGVKPTKITFRSILNSCCHGDDRGKYSALESQEALADIKQIHQQIIRNGFNSDTALSNALVSMYGRCGSLKDAQEVFNTIRNRDVISWSSMINAYAQNDQGSEALQVFEKMGIEGTKPDRITFLSLLDACASLASLEDGRKTHERIIASGFGDDATIKNSLINMYGKCGSLKDAQVVFGSMLGKDVIPWTAMVAAYAQNGQGKEAIRLFQKMGLEGIMPTKITFLIALGACTGLEYLENGRDIHKQIVGREFEPDVSVNNALINMYGKCGSLRDAETIFGEMQIRDVISWNSMIAAYAQNGHGMEALGLLQEMEHKGVKPDSVTFLGLLDACGSLECLVKGKVIHERIVAAGFEQEILVRSALVSMYGKCGSPKDALCVFDRMKQREVFLYTAMITAYVQNGFEKEALELFKQMTLEGVKPNKVTFLSVLGACASLASLESGRRVHEYANANGFDSDVAVMTALLDMYGKCGSLKDAVAVFDCMQQRNIISWNAMIASYAQSGHIKEALELFGRMLHLQEVDPDRVTFLNILNACSHAGLSDEGWHNFVSMSRDHGIPQSEEHYVSMIDLLGRAGSLDAVEELIKQIPIKLKASAWATLLGACAKHHDVERGEHVSTTLDLENASLYVLLSNMYTAVCSTEDVAGSKKDMDEGKGSIDACFV